MYGWVLWVDKNNYLIIGEEEGKYELQSRIYREFRIMDVFKILKIVLKNLAATLLPSGYNRPDLEPPR